MNPTPCFRALIAGAAFTAMFVAVRTACGEDQKNETPAAPRGIAKSGLIVDLNADKGVQIENDQVIAWKNQVDWKVKEFKATRNDGRPILTKPVAAIRGHHAMVFDKKELINGDEDAFDHLITGSGYTW